MEHTISLNVHQEFTLKQYEIDGILKFDIQRIPEDAPNDCVVLMEMEERPNVRQGFIYKAVSECTFTSNLGEGRYIKI
jgi:hypothetical protein